MLSSTPERFVERIRAAVVCGEQLRPGGRGGVLCRPVLVEEHGDQVGLALAKLSGPVLDAGLGEPGADSDSVAVDVQGLAGGGGAAFAVEDEFQELDGLLEGAAGGGGEVAVGGQVFGTVRRERQAASCLAQIMPSASSSALQSALRRVGFRGVACRPVVACRSRS
ncbi:hypothetical protein [Streptomyces cadmiisoli]|uniref:hypothetical protein n=1 Tax=Streptomyces cadmiisoli TaxID=2184053 RepID=UPI003D734229